DRNVADVVRHPVIEQARLVPAVGRRADDLGRQSGDLWRDGRRYGVQPAVGVADLAVAAQGRDRIARPPVGWRRRPGLVVHASRVGPGEEAPYPIARLLATMARAVTPAC